MCVSSSATRIVFCSPMSRPSRPSSPWSRFWPLFGQLQLETKTTSFAHMAFHEDASLVDVLDNLLDQGQSKACALGHPIVGLGSIELIEHKREVLWRYPHAGIGYAGDNDLFGFIDESFDGDRAAFGRVLDRVGQQVEHGLIKHVAVGERLIKDRGQLFLQLN